MTSLLLGKNLTWSGVEDSKKLLHTLLWPKQKYNPSLIPLDEGNRSLPVYLQVELQEIIQLDHLHGRLHAHFNLHLVRTNVNYRLPTKLREGNLFSHVFPTVCSEGTHVITTWSSPLPPGSTGPSLKRQGLFILTLK